jgi:LPXTG-motif cell wall-anchored protein
MSLSVFRAAAGATLAAAIAVTGILIMPLEANAAGVGDESDAVIYGATGPIGDVLTALSDDDTNTTVALPFAINYFGQTMTAVCITTNGMVVPVATVDEGCPAAYEMNLAHFAEEFERGAIGALFSDFNPRGPLLNPSSEVISATSTSEFVTYTTSAPHGFTVGETVGVAIDPIDDYLGLGGYGVISGVPSATEFTVDLTGSGPGDFTSREVSGVAGRDYSSAANADGFGLVRSIYAGPTTVDGAAAFAITWYRMPSHSSSFPLTSNTFQLVFVQQGASGDFVLQFNFGTLTSQGDGYGADHPAYECDFSDLSLCRWAVGWVGWDAATSTADSYELFADSSAQTLVDGQISAIVNNSLNSTVRGRYVLSMIGGVTTGYAVPPLDGVVPVVPDPGEADPAAVLPATGVEASGALGVAALLLAGGLLLLRRRAVS